MRLFIDGHGLLLAVYGFIAVVVMMALWELLRKK